MSAIWARFLSRVKPLFRRLLSHPFLNSLARLVVGRLARYRGREGRGTVEELDALLCLASDVREFLKNSDLQERYYRALARYFGETRFHYPSYQAILDQLALVIQAVPGFEERLWKTPTTIDRFSITIVAAKTHKELNVRLWRLYRLQWMNRLREDAGNLPLDFSPGPREECSQILRRFAAEIEEFDASVDAQKGSVKRSVREKMRSEFYRGLRANRELRRVAATYLYDFLKYRRGHHFSGIDDGEILLEFLRNTKQSPTQVIPLGIRPVPGLCTHIKELIPDPKRLLADAELFIDPKTDGGRKLRRQRGSRRGNYVTRRVRAFHALWTGVVDQDCVGGDVERLQGLTPTRWACPALLEAQSFFVERNGKYVGRILCVPCHTKSGKLVASFDLGVSSIGDKILWEDDRDKAQHTVVLFDIWLPKFMRLLPAAWTGLLASESRFVDNAEIKDVVLSSPHYLCGEAFGTSGDLTAIDPMASRLTNLVPLEPWAAEFGSGLILDAFISDAGPLRQLRIPSAEQVAGEIEACAAAGRAEIARRLRDYLSTLPDPRLRKSA